MSNPSELKILDKPTTNTVLSKSKYNPKIDTSKLFIAGSNIIEEFQQHTFDYALVESNDTTTGRRRNRRQVTNDVSVHLNERFAKLDHVPGLKTTLYPHQQTAVKAMLDLEYTRVCQMISPVGGNPYRIAYNVGVLSEPVGSGKTIDVLATICLSRIPRAVPDIMELKLPHNGASIGFVRCKFKKFLKPTLIFVGSSVMKQWELAIKTFTDLKTYSVNSVIELKVLFDMISNKLINDYDIILVKNGKITVPIELPDGITIEDKNKVGQPYIYNLIANLRDYCWARVVVDDFDTIRLPHNAGIVRGIFTWYISSTRKKMEFRGGGSSKYQLASDMLLHHDYGCANIMYNHFLFRVLNVRNDIEYLKSTTKIPNPKYHVAIFKNPNDRFISLLNSMGDDDINRVTEMLNGDAIGTAAEAVGIKTTSVANIFEKILGGKFKQYKFSGDLLEFIEYQESKEDMRAPMTDNPNPDDKHYGKKRLLDFEEIEYKYPGVNKLLTDSTLEYKEIKESSGLAIQRVKDNIKHGKCPVCKNELDEVDEVIIVKCCNAVFCGKCGINAQNLGDRYNKLQNGRCSNCRSKLSIKDLIYIGDGFNLDNVLEDKFEEEPEISEEEKAKLKKSTVAKDRTKYTAILDIINGEIIPEEKRVDMYIPNMMKGAEYLPEAKVRKVLVFANFDETLKEVVKQLEESDVKYWRLQGGIGEISATAAEFTACKETCALVVNSTRHCSGLNLQTATDLVFTHRMVDPAVESQVAGRGHRLGRKSPLNIWYLAYDNEYTELCSTHSVRELTPEELVHERKMEKGDEVAAVATIRDNTTDCFLSAKQAKEAKAKKTNVRIVKDNAHSDDNEEKNNDSDEEEDD
jgi:hypothetical protein